QRVVTTPTTTTIISSSNVQLPQPFGGCPNINYNINNTVVGTTGFKIYKVSGTLDYVLAPGSTGTVSYVSIVKPLPGANPNILKIGDWFEWAYDYAIVGNDIVSINSSVSQLYVTSLDINGVTYKFTQNATTTMMQSNTTTTNSTTPTTYTITATMSAAANAPSVSYYMYLGPGLPLCSGEMLLITVGNGPYNGTTPTGIRAAA
ncbi:MAG: hypothetical protein ACHQX1_01400, partial [Candidatus Micrarchaeales archaeon]